MLNGVSVLSYNFEVFTGKTDNGCVGDEPDMGASSNVVVPLAKVIPKDHNHKVYADSWFNSIPLQIYMYNAEILILGTVRSNRLKNCSLPSKKK